MLWITYITFYNSRVVGYFATKIINRFSSKGVCFKIGSLTINPIAGKIMFRDIVFVCFDYSFRVLDGYFIFRWWRTYVPKDVSEGTPHQSTNIIIYAAYVMMSDFRSLAFRYQVVGHVKWLRSACLQSIGIVCKARKDVWTEAFDSRTSKNISLSLRPIDNNCLTFLLFNRLKI